MADSTVTSKKTLKRSQSSSESEWVLGVQGGWSNDDQGRKAEERLANDRYDVEAWNVLIRESQNGPVQRGRIVYEKLTEFFPTFGKYWKLWAEHELKLKNFDQVEKIFRLCLMNILSLDLWRFYIFYVRDTKSTKAEFRAIVTQTYKFATEHVGHDPRSAQVWKDYITFLKAGEAPSSYEEEQKVLTIRKAYHTACSQPLIDVEPIWKDYIEFEEGVNKTLAGKLIEERKPKFLLAKKSGKEFELLSRLLLRTEPPLPPKGTPRELQQKQRWEQYIAWEKSNPMQYDDVSRLTKRVNFAYKQCLLHYVHHPDIWYENALYLERMGTTEMEKQRDSDVGKDLVKEARDIYEAVTTKHLPHSQFLHFAHADFEEGQGCREKAEEIYESLLQNEFIDPTLVYVQYMRFCRRTDGVKSARNVFRKAREDARSGHQAYIAAAMMEYHSSKDPNIAFKIFELGLKKFPDDIDYILAYLEYLSHQNEENNTRSLFQRVLATLPPDHTGDILAKFVEFESNVGDLTNIMKVERKKADVYKNSIHSREGIILVDRFKYMDMYPCTEMELKAMEHPFVQISDLKRSTGGSSQDDIVEPDLTQMMAFKPSTAIGVGMNAVPGGHFPPPEAVANLLQRLPPPEFFKGPFVDVGRLMESIVINVPDHPHALSTLELKSKVKEEEERPSRKRPPSDLQDLPARDTPNGLAPPTHDLFRVRQQKRANLTQN